MTYNKFRPVVLAPMETWDETSDVIVWVIEQVSDYHLSVPELILGEHPQQRYNRSHYETLESQEADLEGWPLSHGEKLRFKFWAEPVTVLSGGEEVEGYHVSVETREHKYPCIRRPHAEYLVVGSSRSEFRFAEATEKKLEVKQ